jgi:hypothetical protein
MTASSSARGVQEPAKDKRGSKAVSRGKVGWLRVDYALLGMKLRNGEAMRAAGEVAAAC